MYRNQLLLLFAVISVLAVACASAAQPTPASNRITVEEIVNRVETGQSVETGANLTFLPAEVGQDLETGSGVRTFPDSEARVDIQIEDLLRVLRTTPNTVWVLGQFAVRQDTVIELDQGRLFPIDDGFREGQTPVKVVTPAGAATTRGTWMSVGYDPDKGVAEVQCFRGLCELANGFGELTDARLQRRRFRDERRTRRELGLPVLSLDEPFLRDLEGMPPASGVALGLDRLIMLVTSAARIDDVVAF